MTPFNRCLGEGILPSCLKASTRNRNIVEGFRMGEAEQETHVSEKHIIYISGLMYLCYYLVEEERNILSIEDY